ncbi:MAG: membrane integrity-associated transporter subunit PqiC [Deltaproteobacteria bacterium]|nr:membrane integrity-associated transporter subunit PqiC [Deltaproteobacteria bacterium]
MRTLQNFSTSCLVICLLVLMVTGCRSSTPPVSFYTLTSLPMMEMESHEQSAVRDITIGIGPVQLPQFLNRSQIVTRSGPNRLTVSEFHRWGGYLDQDFLRVLAQDISILLPTNRVVEFPWEYRADPDYRIAFNVQQFDGQPGNSVLLNVTWTIKERKGTKALYAKRSIIRQPVSGNDYEALVSAHSQTLAALSREIAAAIKNISKEVSDQ